MVARSSRMTAPGIGGGEVVREILAINRLLRVHPGKDALISIGWLLRDTDKATRETPIRTLVAEKAEIDDGMMLYTLDVADDDGPFTTVFEATIYDREVRIETFARGPWEQDLDFWYRGASAYARNLPPNASTSLSTSVAIAAADGVPR